MRISWEENEEEEKGDEENVGEEGEDEDEDEEKGEEEEKEEEKRGRRGRGSEAPQEDQAYTRPSLVTAAPCPTPNATIFHFSSFTY